MKAQSKKPDLHLSLVERMRDWFLVNSNEVVGMLTTGSMPHEQFFRELGEQSVGHPLFDKFVDEMLSRQPYKRVLGCQAYRYLRMAVLECFDVQADEWPNYR